MSINTKLHTDVNQFSPGEFVILYELNMTSVGGTTSYFVEDTTSSGTVVYFDGQAYAPIDCKAEGFEMKSGEALPRPTFTIANVSKSLQSEVNSYNDLVGSVLTRKRTFAKYLDDGGSADTSAYFASDIWVVEQKTLQNKQVISWTLSAYLDFEGTYLPKRRIIKDTCLHTYRTYDGGFVYTDVTCPYTDATYFEKDGTPTVTAADDVCGRRMSDCKLRYPLKADELPLWSFPTVAETRV